MPCERCGRGAVSAGVCGACARLLLGAGHDPENLDATRVVSADDPGFELELRRWLAT